MIGNMAWPRVSRSESPGGSLLPLAQIPTIANSEPSSRQESRNRSRSRSGHQRSSSSIAKVRLLHSLQDTANLCIVSVR